MSTSEQLGVDIVLNALTEQDFLMFDAHILKLKTLIADGEKAWIDMKNAEAVMLKSLDAYVEGALPEEREAMHVKKNEFLRSLGAGPPENLN
jgi:hypothetical protein